MFFLAEELLPLTTRGRPLFPLDTVCLGLNMMGGGHFQRIGAIVGGISQGAACRAIMRYIWKTIISSVCTALLIQPSNPSTHTQPQNHSSTQKNYPVMPLGM